MKLQDYISTNLRFVIYRNVDFKPPSPLPGAVVGGAAAQVFSFPART